jgi:CRP/FNR family transcriptional regulator, cyclic AMP receptor protein
MSVNSINAISSHVTKKQKDSLLFSESSLKKLREVCIHEGKYEKDSFVFYEGDNSDKIYYLIKGSVKLTKTTDDGLELELYHVQENEIFGELQSFGHYQNIFNAEAITDCVIGVIPQSDLVTLLWQQKDLLGEFLKWTGFMQRFIELKLKDLLFHGKNGALASTIIRIGNTYGEYCNGEIVIQKKFTNIELAKMINTTRETVNRMIADLKKNGIVDQINGHLVIKNLSNLKKICHCENCPLELCKV